MRAERRQPLGRDWIDPFGSQVGQLRAKRPDLRRATLCGAFGRRQRHDGPYQRTRISM
jgi:hypothetical protein